jgi:hypothetical protein
MDTGTAAVNRINPLIAIGITIHSSVFIFIIYKYIMGEWGYLFATGLITLIQWVVLIVISVDASVSDVKSKKNILVSLIPFGFMWVLAGSVKSMYDRAE